MSKKNSDSCTGLSDASCCCTAEAIVKIDERGQMVFPKELRKKAGIQPGDKFIVISMKKGDKICCFSLIKVDEMNDLVSNFLGPIMSELQT